VLKIAVKIRSSICRGIYHLSYGLLIFDRKNENKRGNRVDADELVEEMTVTADNKRKRWVKLKAFSTGIESTL